MNISSRELWDSLEVQLIDIKNKNLDYILSEKIESLINHFNSLMVNDKQYIVIESIKTIISTVSTKGYFITRNIDKDDAKLISDVSENLSLLTKILVQESKMNSMKKEEPMVNKNRLPNINNDKSLNILK